MSYNYDSLMNFKEKNIFLTISLIILFSLLFLLLNTKSNYSNPDNNESQKIAAGEILLNILEEKGD